MVRALPCCLRPPFAGAIPRAPRPTRARLASLARACSLLVLAVLALGARPTVSAAQDREPPAEAMQFFERARAAYAEGRYPEAAEDLERALVLDPNAPALLFNLGRVYELMGRYDDAIDVYMRLRAVTPPTATGEIARTEQILERLRGAREHAAPPPTVETVGTIEQGPTFVRERGVADVPFWATLIAGGAVVVAAAILGGVAIASHASLRERVVGPEYAYSQYEADLATARALGAAADVAGVIGGATILGALLLFGLRERVYEQWPEDQARRGGTLHVELHLGPASLALAGRF